MFLATFFLLPSAFAAGGQESRRFISDVERVAKAPLTNQEKTIAETVLIFYNARYGHPVQNITPKKAAENLSKQEYANTVQQAAKLAKSPAAKALQATGKAGEKLLKALIITTEDTAKSAGTWIDTKSKEYDERKK